MNIHRTIDQALRPRLLMCSPRYFAVSYSINPWMDPRTWADGRDALYQMAQAQWTGLARALATAGADIETLEPAVGLPDLVFTANAAVVLDRKAVLSRFRHSERRREEPVFAAAFARLKSGELVDEILTLPDGITLEGAGDCVFDAHRCQFWMGCGFRSDAAAAPALERLLGVRCVPLALADASFYHLDTAFCALPCGSVIYYPEAFTPAALDAIYGSIALEKRIPIGRADAACFAANAVRVGRSIILSRCSAHLRYALIARGYAVIETPLDAFHRSGGSASCLMLRLDYRSHAIPRH
jgi:N-dimethylarginine dimethylaminohydrolase